jgi:prepilin-type N-terminal cleavage/methylation domain-containing protein
MKAQRPFLEREAFTLLEMLVAMAVVGLMMAFMFNMVAQAIRTWEVGGRRMEGAQAARIGMNYLAQEMQFAMAGVQTSRGIGNPPSNVVNTIPFVASANAQSLPGNATTAGLEVPNRSDQVFFIAPVGAWSSDTGGPQWLSPFGEIGYMTLFVKSTGFSTMTGQRYYLVRHGGRAGIWNNTNTNPARVDTTLRDFYYRGPSGATANTNWITNGVETFNRVPVVDNCIQFQLEYASNNNGSIVWTNAWPSRTNLPLGVLVTMRVLDTKSANRIAALRGDNKLTAQHLESLTNGQPSTDPVVGILREGTTTLRRFVPLVQSRTP